MPDPAIQTEPPPQSSAERATQLLRDRVTPEPAAAPPPPSSSEPAAEEKPAPDPQVEADAKMQHVLARTQKMESQLRQSEARARKLEEQLQQSNDEWETDPYAAIKKRGVDPREWAADELGVDAPERDKGEVALERLQELEEREEQRNAQDKRNAEQTRHVELQGHVGKFLDTNEFRAVRASPAAVESLAAEVRQMEVRGEFAGMEPEEINRVFRQMAESTDTTLRTEVTRILLAEGEFKRLLKNEDVEKMAREVLGAPSQPSAGTPPPAGGTGNEPRTITAQMASEPGSRDMGGGGGNIEPRNVQRQREQAATEALERCFARQKAG